MLKLIINGTSMKKPTEPEKKDEAKTKAVKPSNKSGKAANK